MSSPRLRSQITALIEPIEQLPLRREIVMTLLIFAESMIVFIYGGTLLTERAHPYDPLPMVLIFATLLIAYQIPHLLETIRIWTPEYELIMGIGLIGSLLMVIKVGSFPDAALLSAGWLDEMTQALILRENDSIRPVWPLVAFVAYAWGRGRLRAEPVLETSYGMLRFGMIWTVAGLLLNVLAMPPDAAVGQRITPAVAGFVVASLLAIALSRNQATQRSTEIRPAWTWVMVVLLPILVVSAATISVAGILTGEMLDLLFTVLAPVLWVLSLVLQTAILLVAVTAFIIIAPLIWFLERQGIVSLSDFPSINLAPGGNRGIDDVARATLEVADPVRYLITSIVLGTVIWVLVRFAFRRRRRWSQGHRQQHESLIEWQSEPLSALQRATRWLRRGRASKYEDPYPSDPRWDGNRRVRRVYRNFLRTNQLHQIIREPHDTPGHFAVRVIQLHDDLREEVQEITLSYNQARYSGEPLNVDVADRTEQAQDRFAQAIQARPEK